MNYSYMKHHYGDNCFYGDTAYKRYARYHMPREINVFTGGCYPMPTNCCGGGWLSGGNFWSGLGIGLGASFGNLLVGGLNMLGGWLGGGFGMGFPSYGFGGGMGLGWGGAWNGGLDVSRKQAKKSDLEAQSVDQTVKSDDDDKTKAGDVTKDKDYEAINKLCKITDLSQDVDVTDKNAVEDFNAKINEMIKALNDYKLADDIMTVENNLHIENQKGMLERLKKVYKPNLTAEELSNAVDGELNATKLGTLVLYFDKLDDNQKNDLKSKLENLLNSIKDDNGYKPPKNYEQAKALELLCKIDNDIICKVEHYPNANDKFIEGSISGVVDLGKGKYSYWVDCKDTGKKIKAQWKFEVQDANTAIIKGVIANDESPEFLARIGMTYNLEDGYYINNNGKETASTK